MSSVARRYASALADVILEKNEAHEIQEELLNWESMIDSSDLLKELVVNPTIPLQEKDQALNQLIIRTAVKQTTANFLRVLLRNQRLTELSEINQRLAHVLDERAGLVSAEVVTAKPVPESSKASILDELRRMTGKKVRVNFTTDEGLIGGAVTKIGSTVYDGSIKNQLQELGKRLAGN